MRAFLLLWLTRLFTIGVIAAITISVWPTIPPILWIGSAFGVAAAVLTLFLP